MIKLTTREHEVIALIAQGLSNKLVGDKLGLAEGTVKFHLRNISKKYKTRSRVVCAVRWALDGQRRSETAPEKDMTQTKSLGQR